MKVNEKLLDDALQRVKRLKELQPDTVPDKLMSIVSAVTVVCSIDGEMAMDQLERLIPNTARLVESCKAELVWSEELLALVRDLHAGIEREAAND